MERVVYGLGNQSVRVVPQSRDGRPVRVTGATYALVDLQRSIGDTAREVVAPGTAATVDTYDQALTATAGANANDARKVSVTPTTGLAVGRSYWLRNASGDGEVVVIDSIVADSFVRTRTPLLKTYPATTSRLQGLEVSVTFPAVEANNEEYLKGGRGSIYAFDLTFTGDARPTQRVMCEVVRDAGLGSLCSTQDVLALEPQVGAIVGDRIDLNTIIVGATDEFRMWAKVRGLRPDGEHYGDAGRYCVLWLACSRLLQYSDQLHTRERGLGYQEKALGLIAQLAQGNVSGVVKPTESTDTAAPARALEAGLFSRF